MINIILSKYTSMINTIPRYTSTQKYLLNDQLLAANHTLSQFQQFIKHSTARKNAICTCDGRRSLIIV